MDESRKLSQVVAQHVCRRLKQIQNADTCDLRRTRLPRPVHPEPRIFHGVATAKRAVKTHRLSGRGALDSKAAEQPVLVQVIFRLACGVPGIKNISRKNYALAARAAREYFLTAFSIPGVAFFKSSRFIAGRIST